MIGEVAAGDGVTEGGRTAPVVAAFDFDGTLTRGGSVIPFLVWVRGFVPVAITMLRELPLLAKGVVFSGPAADQAKERLFARLLAGLASEELEKSGYSFAEHHLRRRLRPVVRSRLDWHLDRGHRVVIVSASPEIYVRYVGELLGADGVVATRLAVGGGGLLTGRYEGKNCRGPEKYARVVGWIRAQGFGGAGYRQPVLWAYGNSRGDLRLMESADHPVDAGQLGWFGRLRKFPRLSSIAAAPRRAR